MDKGISFATGDLKPACFLYSETFSIEIIFPKIVLVFKEKRLGLGTLVIK